MNHEPHEAPSIDLYYLHDNEGSKNIQVRLPMEHLGPLYIYIWRFVEKFVPKIGQITHFPCVTPLLVIKNIPCLTIIEFASKNTKASSSLQQCTCADFFQSDESEDEVELLLREMTSLLAFFCLSFTAMRCRPFLLRCVDKFLWYFASFLSKEVIICFWGPLPYFTQMHFFACAGLARSLREKCNLISQFWSCWIDIFWNRCSLKTNSNIPRKALMIKSIYIQCMRIYIYIVCKWYISW